MTSAPRSARIDEANGPGTNIEKSTTLTLSSGSQGSDMWGLDPVMQRHATVHHDRGAGDIRAKALRENSHRHRGHVRRRAEALQRNLLDHAGRRVEAAAGNRAGRDRIDADAVRAERLGKFLDQHRLRAFRRAVVRQIARRLGMKRSRQQHAALDLALDHLPAERLAKDERGVQVDREHLAPLRLGDGEHRLAFLAARARTVHEDGDAAQPANGLLGELARAIARRQVALDVGLVDVGAEHLGALLAQRCGDAAADAVRRARDERALAVEQLHFSPALARFAASRSRLLAVSTTNSTCLPRPHGPTGSGTGNSNVTRRRSISTMLASTVTLRPSGVAARWSIDTCAPTESSPGSRCSSR